MVEVQQVSTQSKDSTKRRSSVIIDVQLDVNQPAPVSASTSQNGHKSKSNGTRSSPKRKLSTNVTSGRLNRQNSLTRKNTDQLQAML